MDECIPTMKCAIERVACDELTKILARMHDEKERILCEMSGVDKCTLTRLREIISMYDKFIIEATQNRLNFADDISKMEVFKENMKRNSRKFTPLFLHSIQNTYGRVGDMPKLLTQIDEWCSLGVDGFIVTMYLNWQNYNLERMESDEEITKICDYIKAKGKRVFALKVHTLGAENVERFRRYYERAIEDIAKLSKKCAERLIIFNESNLLHEDSLTDWCIDVINLAKDVSGQKVSCSLSIKGHGFNAVPESIIEEMDFISINYYQDVGKKGRATTYEDCLTAWRYSNLLPFIKTYKYYHPTKEIYITESGIMDFFNSYTNPENWSVGTGGLSHGETVRNYLGALMEVLNGNVDGLASWYEIYLEKSIPMIKSYLGVIE